MKKKWFHNLKKNKNRSLLFERECTCNLTNICLTYNNYIGNVDWLCVIFSAHYRCCSLICFWSCVSLVRCYIQLPVRTYPHSSAPSFLSVKEQQQNQFPCLSPPACVCDCSQRSMCCSPGGEMGVHSLTLVLLVYALESFLGQTEFAETGGGHDKSAIFSWSVPWLD